MLLFFTEQDLVERQTHRLGQGFCFVVGSTGSSHLRQSVGKDCFRISGGCGGSKFDLVLAV